MQALDELCRPYCWQFFTHVRLFSVVLCYKKGQADSENWLFTHLYGHDLGTRRCFVKFLHTPCITMLQKQPFWKICGERREKGPRWTRPSRSSQMVQRFSGHFVWNGKRGIRLKISIPVEWAVVPFEFPIGNFCFSKIQLVVYHQCCVLIGWATSRLYVIAH